MTRWFGVVSVAFLVGLLAGVLVHRAFSAGEPAPKPPRALSRPADQRAALLPEVTASEEERPGSAPWLAEIVARLDRAASERHRLEQEVAALHEKVRDLEARITHVDAQDPHGVARDEGAAGAQTAEQEAVDPAIPLEMRLTTLGVDQDRAAEIAERVNEVDLDRLYLRDQATREGWFNTPRYGQALQELNRDANALREDVGDDAYDRYLYASGQVNRVVVGSVIADSAAQEAGLKPGDTVLRYDDQRIFSTTELQSATAAGVAGDLVTVTVQRGGEPVRLYVPRGPLGIRLRPERQLPDTLP
jgi:hypothetical protein